MSPAASAPELGSQLAPAYTVPALAAAVWNHTPAMLAEMRAGHIDRQPLTGPDWEDLFAYLYSVQFLEFSGEARRGKVAFETKQCAACHPLSKTASGTGNPVPSWQPVNDPVTLMYRMWSHSSLMEPATRWIRMDGRDFMDLAAYLQQIQRTLPESNFSLPAAASGKPLFDRHCATCHTGPLALETRLANQTWTDIGAGMWNHVTLMGRVPEISEPGLSEPGLSEPDMRKVLAYVWEVQYRGPEGNPDRGRQTFLAKGCASCHDRQAIGKPVTPASLASIGWGPGRRMHGQIQQAGQPWPHLSAEEVADLTAYLNPRK